MPTTANVFAGTVQTGDRLLIANDVVRVTYRALVRGVDIEIKYISTNLQHRSAGEKKMVVSKFMPLKKVV